MLYFPAQSVSIYTLIYSTSPVFTEEADEAFHNFSLRALQQTFLFSQSLLLCVDGWHIDKVNYSCWLGV